MGMNNVTGISDELAQGIKAHNKRVAPLVGKRVAIVTPDGKQHTGVFGGAAECQPVVTRDDGRRFAVSAEELDRLVAEVAS